MVRKAKTENISLISVEQECDTHRNTSLGYEAEGSFGFIRCLEHGAPNPLIRWHFHEEYELHLMLETNGKMFVGDYIGSFKPGTLVLLGPFLPHNWISSHIPQEGVLLRDFAIQFSDEPIRTASALIPELHDALVLLDRAKQGIEFNNVPSIIYESMKKVQNSKGLVRFSEFVTLLSMLSDHKEYRLLSSVQFNDSKNYLESKVISEAIDYISQNYSKPLIMSQIADRFNMHTSCFSRYFRRITGNNFTDFVNRLRINRTCQLLVETDHYVSSICYKVGYNNVANFNRRFREIKGMTPSEYRRRGISQL